MHGSSVALQNADDHSAHANFRGHNRRLRDLSQGGPGASSRHEEWPHEEFSVGIWAENWTKLSPPPSSWIGKRVCVTGPIERYHGVPNIMAESQELVSVK